MKTLRIALIAAAVFALGAAPLRADVVITELMYHPLSDLDGDEFIELYNTGGASVTLTGWCLKGVDFCFPSGASISAGGYIVLAHDAARFQTTYGFAPDYVFSDGRLSNSGEMLQLVNAAEAVQDQVTYSDLPPWPTSADGEGPSLELIDPLQDNDTPRNWRSAINVAKHTARAANSVAATGLPPWITNVSFALLPAPAADLLVTAHVDAASTVSLTYRIGFGNETTISMFDDGAHGDGGAGDLVFGATIPGQVAASLIRFNINATGPTGSMRYPRTDDSMTYVGTMVADGSQTSSGLPIYNWFIDPTDFQAAIDTRHTDVTHPAVFVFNGVLYDAMEIRVRGGVFSRDWPKKHWKFYFPRGHKLVAPGILSLPAKEFNLQSSYADKSYSREYLSMETYRDAGVPYSQTAPVVVYQNGAYFGLYGCMEALEDEYLERNHIPEDGAWYKANDDARFRNLVDLPPRYEKRGREYEDYSDLFALLDGINNLAGAAKREFILGNVDVPEFINYIAATAITHDNDHVAKNYFLYRDTEGTQRWSVHPYDKDLTFGRNFNGIVLNDEIWADVDVIPGRDYVSPSHPLFGDAYHQKFDFLWNRLIGAILEQPEFREMYFRRLRTLYDDLLAPGRFEARIDALVAELSSEGARDASKWGQYGAAQSVATAANLIKTNYLPVRRTHFGVTHRVPGEIPTAQSANPSVIINEIMYLPAGSTEREFIELYNPSATEAVDLSGWSISGVELTIPGGTVILPHGYVVFVRNDLEFRAFYGNAIFVGGQYTGRLDDGGENLTLRDRIGQIVDSVRYDDDAPWATSADGGGPSLELIDATQDNNRPANWAASLNPGGTPGAANSTAGTTSAVPNLWVNEVLPVNTAGIQDEQSEFAPWIEVYNASSNPIDLAGMGLTNNYASPLLWTFPINITLAGHSYLVVWADAEPGEGPLHASFALSPAGGSVGLYTAGGQIIDYLNYDPLPANVSYGKYPDGGAVRREFSTVTPGAANQLQPAPMILNEYNGVRDDGFLKNSGSDTYWGRVLGNGGDWFELVVIQDHLDIRGWKLVISDDTGGGGQDIQTLTLTNHAIWSDLRSGTIITVSENLADDVSYDPHGGDWWINVRAASAGSGTYITAANIKVSNSNWQLTIRDAADVAMFGPAGEGIQPVSGIGNDEVCVLDEDPTELVYPRSDYTDSTDSTFGAPNIIGDGSTVQDFSLLRQVICIPGPDMADAGSDFATCADGPIPLNGASVNSSATLWATAGDGEFDNPFLLNANYTPGAADIAAGSVVLSLAADPFSPCTLQATDSLTITLQAPPQADAGPDQSLCDAVVVPLAASSTNSPSCAWTTTGDGLFDDENAPTAVYTPGTNDLSTGSAELTWTCDPMAPCADAAIDSITLTFASGPTADAGAAQTLCVGSTASLSGSTTNSNSRTWTTAGDGSFDDATSLAPTYTPGTTDYANGSVLLTLTAHAIAPCASPAPDTVLLTFEPLPTADAGIDQSICAGAPATLTGLTTHSPSLLWSTAGDGGFDDATAAGAIYTPGSADISAGGVTLTLTANPTAPCAQPSTDELVLTIQPTPIADAGLDRTICTGSTVTLAGTRQFSTGGLWTSTGDGTFDDAGSLTAVYTPGTNDLSGGSVELTLSADAILPCTAAAQDSMIITILPGAGPTVSAGADLLICTDGFAILAGSASNTAGTLWSTGGDGAFLDPAVLDTTYTPGPNDVAAGSATLTLTADPVAPCTVGSLDTVLVSLHPLPISDAGPDQSLCNGSPVIVAGSSQFASGCTWTSLGDGSFETPGNLSTRYTPGPTDLTAGSVVLKLTCDGTAPCTSTDDDTVSITWAPGSASGDMNSDGFTNGDDVQRFVDAVLRESIDSIDVCPGDFTLSGVVTVDDVSSMVNRLLGLP